LTRFPNFKSENPHYRTSWANNMIRLNHAEEYVCRTFQPFV
jgi:hypothetical protein